MRGRGWPARLSCARSTATANAPPAAWSARGARDPVALGAGDSLSGDVAIVKNLGLIEPHRIMHECSVLRFSYRATHTSP